MPDTGGYLPPIVAQVTGDSAGLIRVLEDAKAMLADFAKNITTARLGGNATPLYGTIAEAQTALLEFARQVRNARLGADAAPFWADIAALRAEMAAMSPLDINVDANVSAALAQIAALKGALASAQTGSLLDAVGAAALGGAAGGDKGGGGGGGLLGFLGGLFAGKGGAAGGAGILSALGWGGGMFGMAGFGSVLDLMGAGGTSVVTAGLGLGASAGGALLGGGALGLAGLGVGGVGLGTDMAGLGQALNDIKAVTQAQNALTTAVNTYGPASAQAATAQLQYNAVLKSFSPLAVSAVVAAANTAQQFHQLFNAATGAAEATGAQILTQVMQVGEKFLPVIGQYAAQNMNIIKASLQPLFAWLQGPGMAIFKELEQVFQDNLPTGMHAFSQAVELVMRIMGLLAPETGKIVSWFDKLLTRLNGPGWSKFAGSIQKMVGIFHAWMSLFASAGHLLGTVFGEAAGVGTGLVRVLTQVFNQIDGWLSKGSGKNILKAMFGAHFQEVIGGLGSVLLAALPPLESLAEGFMELATAGEGLGGQILQSIAQGLRSLNLQGIVPYVKEIADGIEKGLTPAAKALGPLLAALAKTLGSVFLASVKQLAPMIGPLAKDIGKLLVSAFHALTPVVQRLGPIIVGLMGAIGPFIPIVIKLAGVLADILVVAIKVVGVALTVLAVALEGFEKGFAAQWDLIKSAAKAALNFIKSDLIDPLVNFFTSTLPNAVHTLVGWFEKLPGDLDNAARTAAHGVDADLITPIVDFFTKTVPNAGQTTLNWFSALPGKVEGYFSSAITWLVKGGTDVLSGMWHGITAGWSDGVKWLTGLPGVIEGYFADAGSWLFNAGKNIIGGLINGIKDAAGGIGSAITKGAGGLLGDLGVHLPHLAAGGLVSSPTLAVVGEAGPELVLPLSVLRGMSGQVSPLGTAAVGSGQPDPQLDRIEKLLTRILVESKVTASNTKDTVTAARGLSSPAGVAAQISKGNAQLITAMRAGSSR